MTILSQCSDCAHVVNGKLPGAGMYCEAFPQGIPTSIVLNQVSHKKPYPGDHGIQWKKGDGITPEEFDRRQRARLEQQAENETPKPTTDEATP